MDQSCLFNEFKVQPTNVYYMDGVAR